MNDSIERSDRLGNLESRIGYQFRDRSLLQAALTHRSWVNEQGAGSHYERLEFLGDSVLGLLTADWLYSKFPQEPEGDLSHRLSYLVSAPVLTRIARQLDLGPYLRFGVGEERSGGREKDSLLADTVEAILGALYLDGGLQPSRALIQPFLESEIECSSNGKQVSKDSKTLLQETLQAGKGPLPEYRLVAERGPDHEKTFVIECFVGGVLFGTGEGSTKKRAQQFAAESALDSLSS